MLFPFSFVQAQTNGKDAISFKTKLESISPPAGAFLAPPTLTQLDIPQSSNFTFGTGNPLCPTNDCKQEVIGGFYDISRPLSPVIQGTLKIENKTTSTPDTIKYSMIAFVGNFHVTGMEENRKTGHNITEFSGDFGPGGGTSTIDASTTPEFKYSVNGTLDNTTRVLTFEGERTAG